MKFIPTQAPFTTLLAGAVFIVAVSGCGMVDRIQKSVTEPDKSASNKTLTDKGVDTVIGEETTGVPECDEVMNMLAAEANNPDDSFVTKAVKGTFLNKIKESIRKSVAENNANSKNGAADLAKTCKEFKVQLDKYKAEQASNKGQ